MQGKEFAGQERATGAAAFAAGQIGSEQLHSIEYLIEMQEQSFQRFESFAGHFRKEWQALQATLPLAELERMRRKLLTSPGRGLDKTLAEAWFACCTARMDELHRAEKHLADVLQQLCREKIAKLHGESGQEEISLPGQESPAPLSPLTAFSTRLTADMPDLGNAGFGPQLTQSVVDMLRLQSERLQNLTEELATARAGIEERKLIERAKGILMVHRGLNEESAYRFLRQNAMNQNRRIIDVAHAILSLADMLPGKTD